MPSFNHTIIYESSTKAVAVSVEDFDGIPESYETPVVRTRYPGPLFPSVDVFESDADTTGLAGDNRIPIVLRARFNDLPPSHFDYFTAAEDFLGLPSDYSVPIIRVRYPFEPSVTRELSTSDEDFLGIPIDHRLPIVRARYPLEPVAPQDLQTSTEDFIGLPADYSTPVVRARYPFKATSTQDFLTSTEDFIGLPTNHDIPVVPIRYPTPQFPTQDVFVEVVPDTTGLSGDYGMIIIRRPWMADNLWVFGDNVIVPPTFTLTINGVAAGALTLDGVGVGLLGLDGKAAGSITLDSNP